MAVLTRLSEGVNSENPNFHLIDAYSIRRPVDAYRRKLVRCPDCQKSKSAKGTRNCLQFRAICCDYFVSNTIAQCNGTRYKIIERNAVHVRRFLDPRNVPFPSRTKRFIFQSRNEPEHRAFFRVVDGGGLHNFLELARRQSQRNRLYQRGGVICFLAFNGKSRVCLDVRLNHISRLLRRRPRRSKKNRFDYEIRRGVVRLPFRVRGRKILF